MSLCLGKRLGTDNPPSACSAKIGVKSRAKDISKNTCRFPWPTYVMNFLQTQPIRKREERGRGVFSIKIEHLYTAPPNIFSRYRPHAQA